MTHHWFRLLLIVLTGTVNTCPTQKNNAATANAFVFFVRVTRTRTFFHQAVAKNKTNNSSSSNNNHNNHNKSKSMKQKRKNRARTPFRIPKPNIELPRPDVWEKAKSTDEQIQQLKEQEQQEATEAQSALDKAKQESDERAKELIRSQRKSVAVLTHIKECISTRISGPLLMDALQKDHCYIVDDFLKPNNYFGMGEEGDSEGDTNLQNIGAEMNTSLIEDIAQEILKEGKQMCDASIMTLNLNRGITSGEYTVSIVGGEQYIHCPRSVELVVAITRHLNQCLEGSSTSS